MRRRGRIHDLVVLRRVKPLSPALLRDHGLSLRDTLRGRPAGRRWRTPPGREFGGRLFFAHEITGNEQLTG